MPICFALFGIVVAIIISVVTLRHMSICARVIISVTFQEVDHTPHRKAGPDSYYQCL